MFGAAATGAPCAAASSTPAPRSRLGRRLSGRGGFLSHSSNLHQGPTPGGRASIERLGFKFADVRVLLISHAHWDHDAGSAAIVAATHARYMVMGGDVSVVESGGRTDVQYGDSAAFRYPPARVDRVLRSLKCDIFLGAHGGYFD